MTVDREAEYCKAIMSVGSPPRSRPPRWDVTRRGNTAVPMTNEARHEWSAWAISVRNMCRNERWIEDFNEWSDWINSFLEWYDVEVAKHEQTQKE